MTGSSRPIVRAPDARVTWVVEVSERCNDTARGYRSPPHHSAADARSLAAIILGRPHAIGDGPWQEAIPGGQRTVRVEHIYDGLVF